MKRTLSIREVEKGQELPPLVIEATPTRIVAGALATNDFEPIHHDRDAAERVGRKNVFMNILMTNGLMQRCVTDWTGPEARMRRIRLRLSGATVAGDTLTIRGRVVGKEDSLVQVELEGSTGEEVVARAWVTVELPDEAGDSP